MVTLKGGGVAVGVGAGLLSCASGARALVTRGGRPAPPGPPLACVGGTPRSPRASGPADPAPANTDPRVDPWPRPYNVRAVRACPALACSARKCHAIKRTARADVT